MKLTAAGIAAYLILAGGFCLLADLVGAQEVIGDPIAEIQANNPDASIIGEDPNVILPQNAPDIQTKAIHTMTADERSEILIYDIWKPPELDKVKIGAALSKRMASDTPAYPYGWQAFVAQDCRGSWRGGAEAMAYGGF